MKNYKEIAIEVAKEYENLNNLVGIIWVGSSTYGISDNHVDIDIRLLVKTDKSQLMEQKYVQEVKIEIDEMNWNWLISDTNSDSEQYWIRSKGIILFDPTSLIVKTYLKLEEEVKAKRKQQLWNIYKNSIKDYEISKSIERKEFETATMYILESVQSIIKLFYVYNNQPVPTFKWRWYFLKKSTFLPKDQIDKLTQLVLGNQTLEQKLETIKQIIEHIQQMMIEKGYDKNMVMEYWRY